MTDQHSTWDDIRRLADELDVKIHLAGMDARDTWHQLEPRIEQLEHVVVHSSERASDAVIHELQEVGDALRKLRDQVYAAARGDFVRGW